MSRSNLAVGRTTEGALEGARRCGRPEPRLQNPDISPGAAGCSEGTSKPTHLGSSPRCPITYLMPMAHCHPDDQ